MFHLCRQILVVGTLLTLTLIQCKSPAKTVNQPIAPGSAILTYDNIGLYEVNIEGKIVVENETHYLIIKKILLRGRSAPVISNGDKIRLQHIEPSSAHYSSPVKGTLTCLHNPKTNICSWQLKLINN